jgi:hypothetical protein
MRVRLPPPALIQGKTTGLQAALDERAVRAVVLVLAEQVAGRGTSPVGMGFH